MPANPSPSTPPTALRQRVRVAASLRAAVTLVLCVLLALGSGNVSSAASGAGDGQGSAASGPLSPFPEGAGSSARREQTRVTEFNIFDTTTVGARFGAAGRVDASDSVQVVLERLKGGRWVRQETVKARAGRFTALLRAPDKPGKYLYRARVGTSTSRGETLRVVRAKVAIVLDEAVLGPGDQGTARVTVAPRYTGSKVRIEGRPAGGGTWRSLAAGATNRKGKAIIVYTAPETGGPWSVRALASVGNDAPFTASKAQPLEISTEELVITEVTQVLPEAVVGDPVTAWDPGSGDLTLPDTSAVGSVQVGDVLVLPPGPGFDSGLMRTVLEVRPGDGGAVVFATRQASLTEVFESIPAQNAEIALTQYDATLTNLAPGVTCTNCVRGEDGALRLDNAPTGIAGSPRVTAAQRREEVEFSLDPFELGFTKSVPAGNSQIDFAGNLTVQSSVKALLDVDAGLSGVSIEDYLIQAGIEYDSALSATWEESFTTNPEEERIELGDIEGSWKGFIGVVPFWINGKGTLFIDFSASGQIRVSVELASTGAIRGGIRKSGDGPDGFFETPNEITVTREIGASGSSRAAVGAEIAVDLYSVGGPRAEIGWQAQAEASVAPPDEDGQPFLACSVTHGPFAGASLAINDTVADFLDIDNRSVDLWESDFEQFDAFTCPDGTNPPVVAATDLPRGRVGVFYIGQLDLTDEQDRRGVWSLASGQDLPGGLRLSETGNITGTPTQTGSFAVGVVFTDERDRLGRGTVTIRIGDSPEWDSISPGVSTCGLHEGRGWCWGRNIDGDLGNGTVTDFQDGGISTPVRLKTPVTDFTRIRHGGGGGCALRPNGDLYCWGGALVSKEETPALGARKVTSITKPWLTFDGRDGDFCGIQQDRSGATSGSLWCFGFNGGFSAPDADRRQFDPKRIGKDTDWMDVTVGSRGSMCAIKTDRSLWCIESTGFGPGLYDQQPILTGPTIKWDSIALASDFSRSRFAATFCGIDTGQRLYCWGSNADGQVGTDTDPDDQDYFLTPVQVGDRDDWRQVSVGDGHVCGTTATNAMWCWGSNANGVLGDPDIEDRALAPTQIGFPYWAQVAAGPNGNTCGVRTDGTGWCWGRDFLGNSGTGADPNGFESFPTPQPILTRE